MAAKRLDDTPLLSVADYHAYVAALLPEEMTPELMNGGIVMAARPVYTHMYYAQEIFAAMHSYVRARQMMGKILTEFEVILDHYTVVIPDIAYVLEDSSLSRFTPERLYGPPEFVCEIASPRTRSYDAREKFLAYLRAGVREYWLVDPDGPLGDRFHLFERVETSAEDAAVRVIFQRIAGGPDQSRIFAGIDIGAELW